MKAPAPQPTGKRVIGTVEGCFLPCTDNYKPALVMVVGSESLHLAVFSTVLALYAFMDRALVPFQRVMVIGTHEEFLASIPLDVIVIKDPWYTLAGRVRYLQIQRDPP
jgi:hypothetical protein